MKSSNPLKLKCEVSRAPGSRGNEWFRRFSHRTSEMVGKPWSFMLAILSIVIWACTGPRFHYNDTWQLVINTSTTIITFLMVFLIQNTQNRDAKAIHLKLDELILAVKGARNRLINLENLSEEEMTQLQKDFEQLRQTPDGTRARAAQEATRRGSERAAQIGETGNV